MNDELRTEIKRIADLLMYRVPATPVEGETISLMVEGVNGPELWSRQATTYTLGLMLSGMVLLDEESPSSERR